MSIKVIAIDGYSSTGKSSLAKMVAKKLNYIHIDTGAMYRAITLLALRNNWINQGNVDTDSLLNALPELDLHFEQNPESGKNEIHLNGENVEESIRGMEVSNQVSLIAKIPEVRAFLVQIQRNLAQTQGIVMDGRDIGSVVFPDAPVKIFLTASPEVRAKRRYDELLSHGEKISFEEVLQNVTQRDLIDTQREASPLIKTEDAVEINNDFLNQQETLDAVLKVITDKMSI